MKKLFTLLCTLSLICLQCSVVFSKDEALYEKEPPENAAFFRILNATENVSVDAKLAGVKIATVKPLQVTTYGFTEDLKSNFSFNGKKMTIDTPSKSLTTLVWNGVDIFPITEDLFTSKTKARLKLFNIGKEIISLTTMDNKTKVIDGIGQHKYGYRDVNALTMPFSVTSSDGPLLTTENVSLKKGTVTSLFVIQHPSVALYVKSEEKR